MGKGPFGFIESGIVKRLKDNYESINEIVIKSREDFSTEIGTTFELLRLVADEVRLSVSKQAFPLILAGNCNTTLGAISGLMPRNLGLIWFDAHGDYNTPETTTSGFLDAMGLSMITGHCWQALAKTIPNYYPLPENRVLLVGTREFDETEYQRLESSKIIHLTCSELKKNIDIKLNIALESLSKNVDQVYVHVDLDVHDANLAPANHYKPEGGLTPKEVRYAVNKIANRFYICGASVTAFDPGGDSENMGLHAGAKLIELICEKASQQFGRNLAHKANSADAKSRAAD
jgi:arginase